MRKLLLFSLLMFFGISNSFSQQLYSAAIEGTVRFNPGLTQSNNPKVVFDDILIPSSSVAGRDSVSITKLKVGIRRLANAPAVDVSVYYTPFDDTATLYNNLMKIPPVLLGTVNLPANGASAVTQIVSFGDSVNTLFRLKADTGNVYTNFFTFFVGVGFSNASSDNGWRLASGGSNDDVMWMYNADSTVKRYATWFGGTPPAQFYTQVFGKSSGPFPVELTNFSGRTEGTTNQLTWSTVSEFNNKGFEIERSIDGKNFSSIGFIKSKGDRGNSSNALNYQYSDIKPFAGTNYYRLKQIDNDGKISYSSTVVLKGDKVPSIVVSAIYPNPVKNELNVSINAEKITKGSYVIVDIAGKVLQQNNLNLVAGDNNMSLNVSALSSGIYHIRIMTEAGETKTAQFIKN